jgi:acylphosphatase
MVRKRWVIRGRVQWVGFRYGTLTLAHHFPGLTGFVKNRMDWAVELEAQGEPSVVEAFIAALLGDPPGKIDAVEPEDVPLLAGDSEFRIRY